MPNQTSVNIGLDVVPTSKDPDNSYDIAKLYAAAKILANALDLYTGAIGAESSDYSIADTDYVLGQRTARMYRQAAVSIAAGNTVSLNSSGQFVLGTVGTVVGWAPVAIAAGAYGEIRLFGLCQNIGGLTPGVAYYASSTPGFVTSTGTAQKIGIALAASKMFFNPS